MQKSPILIDQPEMWLAGFNFFGDPFQLRGGWDEENEIGRLWQRFTRFCAEQSPLLPPGLEPGVGYEVHIQHLESSERGEFEVFTGYQVETCAPIPVQMGLKLIPSGQFAVFTLRGEEISADWDADIAAWLIENGWVSDYGFNIQRYDQRFQGMEHLQDSEVDVWVPVRLAGK
jgi:predicted transcriptional regulator YdeE